MFESEEIIHLFIYFTNKIRDLYCKKKKQIEIVYQL